MWGWPIYVRMNLGDGDSKIQTDSVWLSKVILTNRSGRIDESGLKIYCFVVHSKDTPKAVYQNLKNNTIIFRTHHHSSHVCSYQWYTENSEYNKFLTGGCLSDSG